MEKEVTLSSLMKTFGELFSYDELCKLSDDQLEEYRKRLNCLIQVNSKKTTTLEKGLALENLVAYLLEVSGGVFKVLKNVRTGTNEIDEIVVINQTGNALIENGILPRRYSSFLGECKNYSKAVGTTYVGKFYSLLLTTSNTTGILFSYKGISGTKWSDGSGLVKKIYLQREIPSDRTAILDFNIDDFIAIANGDNFFSIIDKKLNALQYDTSISSFISSHPAEGRL